MNRVNLFKIMDTIEKSNVNNIKEFYQFQKDINIFASYNVVKISFSKLLFKNEYINDIFECKMLLKKNDDMNIYYDDNKLFLIELNNIYNFISNNNKRFYKTAILSKLYFLEKYISKIDVNQSIIKMIKMIQISLFEYSNRLLLFIISLELIKLNFNINDFKTEYVDFKKNDIKHYIFLIENDDLNINNNFESLPLDIIYNIKECNKSYDYYNQHLPYSRIKKELQFKIIKFILITFKKVNQNNINDTLTSLSSFQVETRKFFKTLHKSNTSHFDIGYIRYLSSRFHEKNVYKCLKNKDTITALYHLLELF